MSAENIEAVEKIANDVATLSGIFQNLNYWARTFPTAWRVLTWHVISYPKKIILRR